LAGKTALHQDPPHPEIAVQELELALAFARRMKMINWSWEAQGYLAQAYELLGLEDEARAMVNRFYATIDEFRRHIPLSYRHNFDQRHEVQQAMDLAEQIQDPQWRTSPSASELRQLLKINKELNRCLPLDHLLKLILERATELIGAERGFALMREGDVLTNLASYNIDSEGSKQNLTSFSQKVARLVIEQDQPLLATNAIEDGRFKDTFLPQDFLLRAVLCVPLHLQQKATGALYLDSHFKVGAFKKKHLELLEAFADQVDIALENTRMLQDLNADRMALALAKAQLEGVIARQSEELNAISIRLRSQEEDLIQRYQKANIIGQSKLMRELYFKIDRVAESNLPVFIFGESGTGKELIARSIHYSSPRSQQPFIAINCAAIPVHLLESEFFGHKKGAFTDAINDRLGLFELAGSGTLFLDEISDMPLEMQSKLLRVLQEETFRRVGDDQERKSHCRILSASHKRLEDLVALNKFRQDLFYRIKVIQLDIPPLRQRREDIPLLVQHFLASAQRAQTVSPQAMAALIDYNWPGNVRQLENELSRASVLSEKVIDRNALTIPTAKPRQRRMRAISLQEAMQEVEKDFIENALAEADYNVSVAAERLRMHRVALHRKMRQLGISRDKSS
jgi:transcriptional regulator with GAF, ATPase, and Fis domain